MFAFRLSHTLPAPPQPAGKSSRWSCPGSLCTKWRFQMQQTARIAAHVYDARCQQAVTRPRSPRDIALMLLGSSMFHWACQMLVEPRHFTLSGSIGRGSSKFPWNPRPGAWPVSVLRACPDKPNELCFFVLGDRVRRPQRFVWARHTFAHMCCAFVKASTCSPGVLTKSASTCSQCFCEAS